MRTWWVMVSMLASVGTGVQAQSNWFTVTGNPRDPSVNTVQVDPVAVSSTADRKTMNLRVSRSAPRVNWDGVPYRSYESQVAFDCRARKAEYRVATYYSEPLWAGEPVIAADYADKPRPMLFRDMEPNPTYRIVRAACRGSSPG